MGREEGSLKFCSSPLEGPLILLLSFRGTCKKMKGVLYKSPTPPVVFSLDTKIITTCHSSPPVVVYTT